MTREKVRTLLLTVLAIGFVLRFIGIWYGLPDLYNSDEPFNVANALSYGAKKSLQPTYFVYPTLYSYFLFGIYAIYFLLGKVIGVFDGALDFGLAYFLEPGGLFFVGRLMSVVLGVATIWLVYKLAERTVSKLAGLFAALLLSLSYTHADLSHWILLEPAVAFMTALALYCILRLLEPGTTWTRVALAGLVSGLAISTKYNAGFIFVPLFVVLLRQSSTGAQKMARLAIATGALLAGFLIGTPYWLFDFSAFWGELQYTISHMGTGMIGHINALPLVWPLVELVLRDWGLGIVFIAGLIYAFFQRQDLQLLLLSFVIPTLLVVGLWGRSGIHYLTPLFPALCVLAAVFVLEMGEVLKHRAVKIALLALLVLPPLIRITYQDLRLTQKDSRTIARAWIEQNIPSGSVIAYENYVYGPNLFDPRRFLNNPSESRLLPLEIRERLLEVRQIRPSYLLINLRKDFKTRVAGEEVDTGLSDAYLQQLLDLRLPRLNSLKKAGVQYVMISSYNYARYFQSPVPQKGTALWFAHQNGKRFYEEIFKSDELELLKEFSPTRKNLGPIVRIYRFKS